MALVINEEQQMLKSSAKEFLKEKSPIAALRHLRDTKDEKGYDPAVWQQICEMGWTALTIPETYNGLGFGYVGAGQVMEEMGRTLAASPLFTTAWLSAPLIEKAGSEQLKNQLLPAIADGNLLVTLAIDEGAHHRPLQTAMTANKDGEKYYLNGEKTFVLDGNIANKIIVVARTSGQKGEAKGISLFLVDSDAAGLTIEKKTMMDSRNATKMQFEYVAADLIKTDAYSELTQALDIARIGLAAEMLGSMQEAFERTVTYLKERQQFGVPIGVFQGLQHRAAWMFCEIEACKSLVIKSLQAIDKNDKQLPALASMTKAKVGEVLKNVSNEAIQMYGGIGVTDDEEIGFFMKRARVAQRTLGDYNYHLDRFAQLNGF